MTVTLVNGEFTDKISVLDRGLHYGDGVFETIRVHQRQLLFEQEHLDRLQQGAKHLSIPASHRFIALLQHDIQKLWQKHVFDIGVLKIILTRDGHGRGYCPSNSADTPNRILIYQQYTPNLSHEVQGVTIGFASKKISSNPELAGIKHLNRLEQVIASIELQKQHHCQELLLFDEKDFLVEGTCSNVFLYHNQMLLTPDLANHGIKGIIRQHIIQAAKKLGIPCHETSIARSMLKQADGLFLCNSLRGIWPVIKLEKTYSILPEIKQLQMYLESLQGDTSC